MDIYIYREIERVGERARRAKRKEEIRSGKREHTEATGRLPENKTVPL